MRETMYQLWWLAVVKNHGALTVRVQVKSYCYISCLSFASNDSARTMLHTACFEIRWLLPRLKLVNRCLKFSLRDTDCGAGNSLRKHHCRRGEVEREIALSERRRTVSNHDVHTIKIEVTIHQDGGNSKSLIVNTHSPPAHH